MGKRIVDFEVINHGADHNQYFPGCGVSFTRFSHVVTGCGGTPFEAVLDALDQIQSMGEDYDTDGITIADLSGLPSEIPTIEPGDEGPEDEPGDLHPEWYHYVSVRWND